MAKYGLIGRNIEYSFSKAYFTEKFKEENSLNTYENFDIQDISAVKFIIKNTEDLKGLNVTIPYKEKIIPFLDEIDKIAQEIGAVNTIKIKPDGKLVGYNTDAFGFENALLPFFPLRNKTALILGTGGASKAVAFVLQQLGFEYYFISRKKEGNVILYSELNAEIVSNHNLIINCTPVGTYPNTENFPNIPYTLLTKNHVLFDLIYNPLETQFLRKGKMQGARTINGLSMLHLQAQRAWEIWNA